MELLKLLVERRCGVDIFTYIVSSGILSYDRKQNTGTANAGQASVGVAVSINSQGSPGLPCKFDADYGDL